MVYFPSVKLKPQPPSSPFLSLALGKSGAKSTTIAHLISLFDHQTFSATNFHIDACRFFSMELVDASTNFHVDSFLLLGCCFTVFYGGCSMVVWEEGGTIKVGDSIKANVILMVS